jgi:hypothetical protein
MPGKKKGTPQVPVMTDETVQFVLASYARFDTAGKILRELKERFGIEPSYQLLQHYNPRTNKKLAPRHLEYFRAARDHYLAHPEEYGIYHATHRVALLESILEKARDAANGRGNPILALQALNAARQEMQGKAVPLSELARVFSEMGVVVAKTVPPHLQKLHDVAAQMCRAIADIAIRSSCDLPIKADPTFRSAVNGKLAEALATLGAAVEDGKTKALEEIERQWDLVDVKPEKGSG